MDKCDYCGKKNESNGFWIGTKREGDEGFTMVEGTGKMACKECYPGACAEAKKVIDSLMEA